MISDPVWVVVVVGAVMGLALVASMLALVGVAVLVVLRLQRQWSFIAELLARQGASSSWDYAERARADAAASGRCKDQPGTPPSSASDEGKPQQDAVPLSDTVDMAGFDPTQGRL